MYTVMLPIVERFCDWMDDAPRSGHLFELGLRSSRLCTAPHESTYPVVKGFLRQISTGSSDQRNLSTGKGGKGSESLLKQEKSGPFLLTKLPLEFLISFHLCAYDPHSFLQSSCLFPDF